VGERTALYVIWYRELIKWARKRAELISSLLQPIMWLFIFGVGLKDSVKIGEGVDFLTYLAPGVICQTILFSAFFNGVSILMDREFGFLKEIMVSPIKRQTIIAGKLLGGATIAFIQGCIAFFLSLLLGVQFGNFLNILLALLIMFLISMAFMAMGLAIATKLKEIESFQKISRFTTMPMWFLSGGFYPVSTLPVWLKVFVYLNPLTYGVDALRTLLIGVSQINMLLDLAILICFTFVMLAIGAFLFNKSDNF
jgi:ABC-2 type transport system permease protein